MRFIIPILTAWLILVGEARARMPARELPIDITVKPAACLTPCKIVVEVVVPPALTNRQLIIEVDGPEFQASSIELAGVNSPKRFSVPFSGLSAGQYDVRGILLDSVSETSRITRLLLVSGDH